MKILQGKSRAGHLDCAIGLIYNNKVSFAGVAQLVERLIRNE